MVYKSSVNWEFTPEDMYGSDKIAIAAFEETLERHPNDMRFFSLYPGLACLYVKTGDEPSADVFIERLKSAMKLEIPSYPIFIPVDTLTYRGLWIEGFSESQLSEKEQHDVIRAARNSIFHEDRISTGVFIPDSLKQTIAPDLLTAATDYGQYHRWEYAL